MSREIPWEPEIIREGSPKKVDRCGGGGGGIYSREKDGNISKVSPTKWGNKRGNGSKGKREKTRLRKLIIASGCQ